jgi:hypothetical protein
LWLVSPFFFLYWFLEETMSSSQVDTTVRFSFALVNGLVLAIVLPVAYMFAPLFTDQYLALFLFVIIPAISFLVSIGLNALTQYIACNTVDAKQIALASSMNPVFVLGFGLISYFLPFLRDFVIAVLPESADETMKKSLSYAFYLLWGGIYGQTFCGGFAQSCPASTKSGGAGPK